MTSPSELVDQQEAFERRTIVELLKDLKFHREKGGEHTGKAEDIGDRIKQYLALENLEEITDGERGIRAYLKDRSATTWDVASMPQDMILALANTPGLMTINTAAFDKLRKKGSSGTLDDANNRYRINGVTKALMIEEIKR